MRWDQYGILPEEIIITSPQTPSVNTQSSGKITTSTPHCMSDKYLSDLKILGVLGKQNSAYDNLTFSYFS